MPVLRVQLHSLSSIGDKFAAQEKTKHEYMRSYVSWFHRRIIVAITKIAIFHIHHTAVYVN